MSEFDANKPEEAQVSAEVEATALADQLSEDDPTFVVETGKPRNSVAMVMMTLMLLGAGAIYVMRWKAGPQQATASPQTTEASKTINQFLTSGDKDIMAMRELLKNTEKIVEQFLKYPLFTQVQVDELQTNPFRSSLAEAKRPEVDPKAEYEKKMAAEKAAVEKDLGRLKLQSVLTGSVKTCMLNNTMCQEGTAVEGFVIEKITADGVVVRRESETDPKKTYRYQLKMSR